MDQNELYHYGVAGMKWGVRKSVYKQKKNIRLLNKAYEYDKKSAQYAKESEKVHAKKDLGGSNKAAVKAANYRNKSAALGQKAANTSDAFRRSMIEKKVAKLQYKAQKNELIGNRKAKTVGYGMEAMKYSIKSDKMAKKAAKARLMMANNKAYAELTKRKISSLPQEQLQVAKDFMKKMNFT